VEPTVTAPEPAEPPDSHSAVVSRRRLVGVAGLALAGAALSGRVSNRNPRAVGGAALTSFTRRRRLRVALDDQHAVRLAPLISRFEEEHDTAIEVMALPAPDLYSLLAVELLHETQAVDVVSMSDDWIPSLGRSAVLMSDGDLASDEFVAGVDQRVIELGRSLGDDRRVAVPWMIDIGFTAVNIDAVGMTTVPRRWSEFAELIEGSGSRALALAGASGEVAATTFRAILIGHGSDIVEPVTNRPTVVDYDARRAIDVMRRLQALTTVSPLAVDDRAISSFLARGTITSCVHVWASTWLDAGAPAGWTLLPPLRASAPRGSRLLRCWLLAIPKTALDVELSRTFVAWMLESGAQRSLLDAGLIPSTMAVLEDRDELATRPGLGEIVRGLSSSVARPRLRAFPDINRVCGEAVAAILADNASPGEAFRAANAEMRRILEREGELRL